MSLTKLEGPEKNLELSTDLPQQNIKAYAGDQPVTKLPTKTKVDTPQRIFFLIQHLNNVSSTLSKT